jgi:hypothetical protein
MRLRAQFALGILAAVAVGAPALASAAGEPCDRFSEVLPPRPSSARPATEMAARLQTMDVAERDATIAGELLAGNMPGFLRQLAPIQVTGRLDDGQTIRLTFCALPDYLAIGSDDDYLLVPMQLQTALVVADNFGFLLPTRKMVDAIYQQASVRLKPQPLPAGPQMRSTDYYWQHNRMVAAQRASLGLPLGSLTAGDKKDLVLSNRLWLAPRRVAIYGWHLDTDRPIQPLSTVHGARYVDYSHGVRLVAPVAYVDGVARSVVDVLKDRRLAPLLSDEGPFPRLGELLDILKTALDVVPALPQAAAGAFRHAVLPARSAP